MKKTIFAVALASACSTANVSYAKTGAELLQDPELFGMGFVWGAANYMASDYTLNDDIGNKLTMHRAKCLANSGITVKTLYDAVVQEIKNDPSELSMAATGAVQNVMYKMCGPPPGD